MAIISFLDKGLSSKVPSGRSILTVAVCCAFALQSFPVIAKSQETNEHIFDHFKPAAEWLCEQDNVLTKGSCIIVSDFKENATNGWAEYYLNKQGQRSYINVTSYAELVGPNGPEEFDMEEFYQTYKHVYRFCRIGMQNKDFDRLLEGSYTQTGGAENLCILEYKRVKR